MEHKHQSVIKNISDLKQYAKNARTHSELQIKQIADAIQEFGFTNPILIDPENNIIAGHGRLAACHLLNYQEIPCIILNGLTETQRRAYVIADNQLALNAKWDSELLAAELTDLKDLDFDLDLLGFDDDLAEVLMPTVIGGLTSDDEIPVSDIIEPLTKLGDIWQLSDHRLMCGDSTKSTDVLKLMNGCKADLLLTDPPYNINFRGGITIHRTDQIKNDKMLKPEYINFLDAAFCNAHQVLQSKAVYYIWFSIQYCFEVITALRSAKLQYTQLLTWSKNHWVLSFSDYQKKTEHCFYGWKDDRGHLWQSDRSQTDVLNFDRPQESKLHPTMKPVQLFEYLLLNSSKPGQIVLDLFGGSGTTLIACEKNHRVARIMELDPKYVDIIKTRWEEYTGRSAKLEQK